MSSLTICGANLLIVLSLAAVTISLATEYWVKITVDRDQLPTAFKSIDKEIYYTRYRGIFRTCFEGESQWLKNYDPIGKVVKSNCLIEDIFGISNKSATVSLGSPYSRRSDLIMVHLAFQAIAIILLLFALFVGLCGCHKYSASTIRISGVLAVVASLFVAAAMAIFHVYEYIEKQEINNEMFHKVWSELPALQGRYTYKYHFSYMLAWIGMALAFCTALMYFFLANDVLKEKERIKDRMERHAEERKRNYDHLVENTPRDYGRSHMRDPYHF